MIDNLVHLCLVGLVPGLDVCLAVTSRRPGVGENAVNRLIDLLLHIHLLILHVIHRQTLALALSLILVAIRIGVGVGVGVGVVSVGVVVGSVGVDIGVGVGVGVGVGGVGVVVGVVGVQRRLLTVIASCTSILVL